MGFSIGPEGEHEAGEGERKGESEEALRGRLRREHELLPTKQWLVEKLGACGEHRPAAPSPRNAVTFLAREDHHSTENPCPDWTYFSFKTIILQHFSHITSNSHTGHKCDSSATAGREVALRPGFGRRSSQDGA